MKWKADSLFRARRRSQQPRLEVLEGRLAPGDAMLSQVLGLMVFGEPLASPRLSRAESGLTSSFSVADFGTPADLFALPSLSGVAGTDEGATFDVPAVAAPVAVQPREAVLDNGLVSLFEVAAPAPGHTGQVPDHDSQLLFGAASAAGVELPPDASILNLAEEPNPSLLAPRADWSDYLTEMVATAPQTPLPPGRAGGPSPVGVDVVLIDFNGPANVNIRFDQTLDFGDLGSGLGGDLEWQHYVRDQPNTTEIWDTTQSAPAAFVKDEPLTADVLFWVDDPTIDSIFVHADNPGAYGGSELSYVYVQDGWGWARLSTASSVSSVAVNDLTFSWTLDYACRGEKCDYKGAWLLDTTHRIYTLHNQPVGGMAQPWATVLEVAGGMAGGHTTDVGIVEELTRGVHYSAWRELRGTAHFLDPQAVFVYNPSRAVRSRILGPGADRFTIQDYNLTNFMSFLSVPETQQQCNDNTNLLTLWLGSLGVSMAPLYFARNITHSLPLNRTSPYFPAGRTTATTSVFNFHQIGQFGGLVYDLSTRAQVAGDPTMSMSFLNYLDFAFPNQRQVGYVSRNVTTINPGPGVGQTEFTLVRVGPNTGERGTTVPVVLEGAGFDAALTLRAVENGTTTTAAGVTLANRRNLSTNKIAFDLVIAPTAVPRMIQILGTRGGAPAWWPARASFSITV